MKEPTVADIAAAPQSATETSAPARAVSVAHAAPSGATATLSVGPRWTLGRLTRIEIENYRGVRGHLDLEMLNGSNLLIYGENGAGKSSIFYALRDFLESVEHRYFDRHSKSLRRLVPTDHANRFATQRPRVVLHFGDHEMAWSDEERGPEQREARDLDKGKGFLDYKGLLAVHYAPTDDSQEAELFSLLIFRLLPYYTFPYQGQDWQFQSFWQKLNADVQRRWVYVGQDERFYEDLAAFNESLKRAVDELGSRASMLMERFDKNLLVDFSFEKALFKTRPKRVEPPRIVARPVFRKLQIPDYSRFFNEARLSALAISLFFAALKESPATGLRILALDDILIGLDMANRLIVLELIHEHCVDWQILIFTYSKAWFELLKERVQKTSWSAGWHPIILREEVLGNDLTSQIVAEGSGDMLQIAHHHLQRKDYKAAAVYVRSALESVCHSTCARAALPVLYVDGPRRRKLEHFLNALEPRLKELIDGSRRQQALELVARLKEAREFVLNRNAHFDAEEEDTLTAEVKAALQVVEDFANFLTEQTWENSHFCSGLQLTDMEKMAASLASAREFAAKGAKRSCQGAMACAHEFFWHIYGAKLNVAIPLGTKLTARSIWDAADAKIPVDAEKRLSAAKPYLFGSVKPAKFDATKFEDAAKVIEELTGVGAVPA